MTDDDVKNLMAELALVRTELAKTRADLDREKVKTGDYRHALTVLVEVCQDYPQGQHANVVRQVRMAAQSLKTIGKL